MLKKEEYGNYYKKAVFSLYLDLFLIVVGSLLVSYGAAYSETSYLVIGAMLWIGAVSSSELNNYKILNKLDEMQNGNNK